MTRKTTEIPRLKGHEIGSLVPMPHGGALRNGGPNRGGSGRPPAALRARSRAMYDRILDEIESRNLSEATIAELSQLANTTARYGLGIAHAVALNADRQAPAVVLLPALDAGPEAGI